MLALRPWWRPALGRRRPSSDLRLLRSIGSPVPASSSSTSSSSNSASSTPAANNNDGGGVAGSGGAGGPRQGPLDRPRTAALREWTAALGRSTLDRSRAGCDVRFDRSGGKGGQNVNKLNTKVRRGRLAEGRGVAAPSLLAGWLAGWRAAGWSVCLTEKEELMIIELPPSGALRRPPPRQR